MFTRGSPLLLTNFVIVEQVGVNGPTVMMEAGSVGLPKAL